MKNAGAVTKFSDSIPERAYRLCLLGLTNKELAIAFGVSVKTIESWYKKSASYRRACDLGRQEADAKVAAKLFELACGYEHPDVHIAVSKGEVIVTDIVKHYPPVAAASIFWLKNRQKDKWADVWKLEHSGMVDIHDSENSLTEFTDEELDLLEKLGLQKVLTEGNTNERSENS